MKKIFGIVGWSGSEKTDLICRLIEALEKNVSVGSIKHTHHYFIDKEGRIVLSIFHQDLSNII